MILINRFKKWVKEKTGDDFKNLKLTSYLDGEPYYMHKIWDYEISLKRYLDEEE